MRSFHTPAFVVLLTLVMLAAPRDGAHGQPSSEGDWPAVTSTTKPWTRWWWHGSAVDPASLTGELEALEKAGLGGVEITPIYGVRGEEAKFIPYLSPAWARMLDHTLREAQRVGIGVDLATGTGWPFGGPWVGEEAAPRTLVHRTWTVQSGQSVSEPIRVRQTPLVRAVASAGQRPLRIEDLAEPVTANPNLQALALDQVRYPRDLPLVALMAYGSGGEVIDLTARVDARRTLAWTAPPGTWTLYAVFSGWHGKLVERAAPGGEGNVIDHFSGDAIRAYLARFDAALPRKPAARLRAFFNDSYEVDDASGEADWTPRLFEEFRRRRGYDLTRHLPALLARDAQLRDPRIVADYRETISDLLLETFTTEWAAWARRRGALVRNQAHGSPANLLDLYAASDIPETEGSETRRFKWATSAAHVAGRRLVAAEAATWLGEHFRTTLADVRSAVDDFFLGGVNHIVYHGTAFSPADEPWPGWQFYASVEFNPRSSWWADFGALNQYVTRVQSFLQAGRPDHDVLLYFPFHDAVAAPGPALLTHFGGANQPTAETFESAAAVLESRGFTYDYISDRQLAQTRSTGGHIRTGGGGQYRVLVLPPSRYIPLDTLERVVALAREGATVVVWKQWPADVAGFHEADVRRRRLRTLLDAIEFAAAGTDGVSAANVGRGRVLRGDDLEHLLTRAGVNRETIVDRGLRFVRRASDRGRVYFLCNRGDRPVDGWIRLETSDPAAIVFDPMHGGRGGVRVRLNAGAMEVYLELPVGSSLIVATTRQTGRAAYPFYRRAGDPIEIAGPWVVTFVAGGPVLPAPRTIDRLRSWTTFGGDEVRNFSGSATYAATFARPQAAAGAWEIDLGRVHESARVSVNGRSLGTAFGSPFCLVLDPTWLVTGNNRIEVTVTNLPANRIADLDRRGVAWKKFYNINFPARLSENRGPDGLFTAARWEPLPSGLVGPVMLRGLALLTSHLDSPSRR